VTAISVRLLTVAEIARLYQVRPSYVYWLASMHKWRRLKHEGRVYYDLDDVDRALGR
jgi:hypothetical protein